MIFDRIHGKVNLTSLIERKSRYTILAKNDNRRPLPVISTIRDRLKKLPSHGRQTITFDRGFEFMSYPLLRRDLGMDSYFCDPQAPWQKGAVESNNSRIRRFLSRETNLATLSDADLYEVRSKPSSPVPAVRTVATRSVLRTEKRTPFKGRESATTNVLSS